MSRAHCTKLVPRARLFRPPARQLVPREEALPTRPPLAAPRERQGPGHRDLHGRIPRRLPGVLRPLHLAPQRGAWPLRRALCRVGGRRGAREPVDRRQPHRHLPVGLVSRGAPRLVLELARGQGERAQRRPLGAVSHTRMRMSRHMPCLIVPVTSVWFLRPASSPPLLPHKSLSHTHTNHRQTREERQEPRDHKTDKKKWPS